MSAFTENTHAMLLHFLTALVYAATAACRRIFTLFVTTQARLSPQSVALLSSFRREPFPPTISVTLLLDLKMEKSTRLETLRLFAIC